MWLQPPVPVFQVASRLPVTLELMGDKDVSNYYRSWAEWGTDPDPPVVKPKK